MFRIVLFFLALISAFSPATARAEERAVSIPAMETMKPGDYVTITNGSALAVRLVGLKGEAGEPAAAINISAPGGCSPEAAAQGCLGPPGYSQDFVLAPGEKASAIGIDITLDHLDGGHATLKIAPAYDETQENPDTGQEPLCDSCDFMKSKEQHP